MSHLTPIKAQTANLSSLIAALKAMGLDPQQGDLILFNDHWEGRGYKSGEFPVQVLVSRTQIHSSCKTDIGWRWDGSTYEMIADQMELGWWVCNPASQGYLGFVHQLHDKYALAQMQAQYGSAVEESREVLPDGTIRYTLQYASTETQEEEEVALMVRG
jgi:hypothetical protein